MAHEGVLLQDESMSLTEYHSNGIHGKLAAENN